MQPVIWGAVKIYAHKIPERMGWKFYYIWSTDWFRNKSAECEQKELGDAKEARGTTFSFLNHTYHLINNHDLYRPIFCLYGVYDAKHGNTSFISIPEKMKAFGTYAVVVTDVEEFLNRLRRVPLIFSPIDYQELDLHDPNSKTPFRPYFHKGKYFKYQS